MPAIPRNKRDRDAQLLRVKEVAQRLKLPERSVRYRLEKGELVGRREGRTWWVDEKELKNFLERRANVQSLTWRQNLKKDK